MKLKLTAVSTTIMLGLGSAFAIPSVKAETNQSSVQSGINNANSAISQYQSQLDQLNAEVARADQAYNDNEKVIADTQKKITDTEAQVAQLNQQISTIQDRITKRNDILKKRAQSIQESGGTVSYLDVLMGSSSFGDFIDRVGAVSTMVQADQDIIKQQMADKQEVEKKQEVVGKELASLKSMKTDLEGMQQQILQQKAQNDALKADLQNKQTDKIAERAQLQQQQRDLAAQAIKAAQAPQAKSNNSNSGNINLSVPKVSGSINDVISAGYKLIGNSTYVFGGGRTQSDIANGRFDCSGFVHWAFAQAGYNIGSSTDALVNSGSRVSPSDMRPGDLVFFDTYKRDGHVGIYLGGGNFIGCQNSTGVAVANLTSGYWKGVFNGHVVRIIN
ncbi:coiled-coil domain-containing protein [Neobacillus massiliamazoniensis]|uniref:Secreted cell wall DL-endopeptidase n=1 Tax=Neobacillus massiliamazoniensis TaxID=1499688 RepID=A0A0U1NRN6_9BACI|nr:C40 family peptidase [Neobacillus massiliamazoniensis]CRK80709.1 secreted cell wall DL-endopeptidase [Neobacillus massiliamazoniensis]